MVDVFLGLNTGFIAFPGVRKRPVRLLGTLRPKPIWQDTMHRHKTGCFLAETAYQTLAVAVGFK